MNHPITSASNLHRRKSCPGSQALESFCLPEPESNEASEGTMLHEILASENPDLSKLTDEQRYCIEFCLEQSSKLKAQLLKNSEGFKTLKEARLVLNQSLSGQPDLISFDATTALISDWKFGRIPVDAAEANMQLRVYAVIVNMNYGVSNVYAAIIQPRLKAEDRVTVVHYDAQALSDATNEIYGILEDVSQPNAPLNPTESGCRYCRANSFCPALSKQSNEIEKVTAGEITTRNAAELYSKAKIVEKHVDAIKSAIFLLVKESEEKGMPVEGLTLKSGSKRRIINDASKAYGCLSGILTPETFASCCTVKVSDLDEAYKTATGSSLKAAKQALESLLTQEGCLEVKQSEPSLVLTK